MTRTAPFLVVACIVWVNCAAQPADPPVSRAWVATSDMTIARRSHTATLLQDGTVLVTGGYTANPQVGHNQPPEVPLASAELYDPSTGAWRLVAAMSLPRIGHTGTLLGNGQVLVVGSDSGVTTAELYDPPTDHWFTLTSPSATRFDYVVAALPKGKALLAGDSYLAGPSVYRLWNDRADSDHRYTTSRDVQSQMLARGYIAEGYGPDAVAFCAGGGP